LILLLFKLLLNTINARLLSREQSIIFLQLNRQLFILQKQSSNIDNETKIIVRKLVYIVFSKKKKIQKYKFNSKFI